MLLGREAELDLVRHALEEARSGLSSAVIFYGEPGIGKSALLAAVAQAAEGFQVLRASPLQAESELPFAGLADLVRPLLGHLDRIPAPQAAALCAALALGPPTPGDRFAAAAATISLLAAGAQDRPVLALVDDAHWLDTASREAILFAGRRLNRDRVVVLLAMHDAPWRMASRIRSIELSGLASVDVDQLVLRSGKTVASPVREWLLRETGGNPLALVEALQGLSDAELSGEVTLTGHVAIGDRLQTAIARRLDPLPAPTRRALLVAAVSDTGDISEIRCALDDQPDGAAHLEAAEIGGLIEIRESRVHFIHPLLRSAVYRAASPVERRRAHSRLAIATDADRPDRAAWHAAAATIGPDEAVAGRLTVAAADAQVRHGYSAAAQAYVAAARLTPMPQARQQRMLQAGSSYQIAGQGQAANNILLELLDQATDPLLRADAQLVQGSALLMMSQVSDAALVLADGAEAITDRDPGRAASMLAIAVVAAIASADIGQANRLAERAVSLANPLGGHVQMVAELASSFAQAMAGRTLEARRLLDRILPTLESLDPVAEGGTLLITAAHTLCWIEDWTAARRIFRRLIPAARRVGALTLLPHPLAVIAEMELRHGRTAAAYSAATESLEIASDTGEKVQRSIALVSLARVEAVLGLEQSCRRHAMESAREARRLGATAMLNYSAAVLGMLELSLGRPAAAVEHLSECSRLERHHGVGLPTAVLWNGDLIECYLRLGRRTDAIAELNTLASQAESTGITWAAGVLARCRGLLAPDEQAVTLFRQAIDLHGGDLYERGRSRYCLGRTLRHSRRRAEARTELHLALADFQTLDARTWIEQTNLELRAAGEATTAGADPEQSRSLTPRELNVALAVADGATNKEAAAALFITTKTVEFHLGHIYQKLAVRSRTELARTVARWTPGIDPGGRLPAR